MEMEVDPPADTEDLDKQSTATFDGAAYVDDGDADGLEQK